MARAVADDRLQHAPDGSDLADEVAAKVDDVGAEVAERAGARLRAVEAPRHQSCVKAPVLQVARAEVMDLAQLAARDQLPREPHGRHEAVVEGAHVDHTGSGDALPDLEALVRVAPERLLADDMLARLGGGDRRLAVEAVGTAVVEQLHALVRDQL